MNTIGFGEVSPADDAMSSPKVEPAGVFYAVQVAKLRIEMLRVDFLPARKPESPLWVVSESPRQLFGSMYTALCTAVRAFCRQRPPAVFLSKTKPAELAGLSGY